SFEGELITETMLVKGINDNEMGIEAVAQFISTLQPSISYISVPTRPPSESWVEPPEEETLNLAYMKFSEILNSVEFLISYEGTDFSLTGKVEDDLLAITSVHPMREDAVRELLRKDGADISLVEKLIEKGLLIKTVFRGNCFYLRSFSHER
ncbi:MAG: radical SAM protein, partial [Candidatus Aegiribacteria sp.]|nr:radical SAM protein [Candidatus Aegiribacteria sp.]